MTTGLVTAALLIAVPIAFNLPIAYIAWSLWLVALGILLLV